MHRIPNPTPRRALTALAASTLLALGACSGGEDVQVTGDSAAAPAVGAGGADSAAGAAAAATVPREGETTGFATPESARFDPQQDVYFVSNIDGNPSAKDGKAFIAKIDGGNIRSFARFVEGGVNGATLNAPKGMAIVGDTLWVADIDAVRGFHRVTGATVATIEMAGAGAVFLNDIAVEPSTGALYVTDTGVRFAADGSMSPAGPGRIFKVAGRTVTVAASGDAFGRPNGIAWDAKNAGFVVAPFDSKTVFTWREGDRTPARLADGPGMYDGIEELEDGRLFVTSWADSSVYMFNAGELQKVVGGVDGPADIGVDTKRNRLIVPRFMQNTIEYYPLDRLQPKQVPTQRSAPSA